MKRAIFIIACNYRGNRSMRELNVGRDMVGLGGFFEHIANYDIVEIVVDLHRQAVLEALQKVLAVLSPGDTLVIYFGGHGVQRTEHLLLLPPGPQDPLGSAYGFLPVQELRRQTEGRGLSRGMILDCCRNDDAAAGPVSVAVAEYSRRATVQLARDLSVESHARTPANWADKGSFAIFCACSEDEVAPEVGDTGKGLFSTALVAVLKRAHQAGHLVQLDDSLRTAVEEEMLTLAASYRVSVRPKPWKAGNGTPELIAGSTKTPQTEKLVQPKATAVSLPQSSIQKPSSVTSAYESLFPVYGVTFGVTTLKELKKIGYADEKEQGYFVGPIYFSVEAREASDDSVVDSFRLRRFISSSKMPEKWWDLGFDWKLSYKQWMRLFARLNWKVDVITPPRRSGFLLLDVDWFLADIRIRSGPLSLKFTFDNVAKMSEISGVRREI